MAYFQKTPGHPEEGQGVAEKIKQGRGGPWCHCGAFTILFTDVLPGFSGSVDSQHLKIIVGY